MLNKSCACQLLNCRLVMFGNNRTHQTDIVTERSSVLLLNFIIMKQKFMAFVCVCLCLVVHFFKGTRNYVERIPLGFQKPNDTELTLMYDVSIKFVLSVSLCVSRFPQDPTKHILFRDKRIKISS